ncbi:hypothetical protein WSM22_12110 [Cytophagales bacterium WSM2-2]|nr:hypothetical protein WSM22_12110 [Cytophagales bacterium WSM2-2]
MMISAKKLMAVVVMFSLFAACTQTEIVHTSTNKTVANKLDTRKWNISSVTMDGEDIMKLFSGFSLSISADNNYTAVNVLEPVWKDKGSFTTAGIAPGFQLIRNEGTVMDAVQSDTKLVLDFWFDRVDSSGNIVRKKGKYHFEFN